MPEPEDSLGGETFSGDEQQDPAEQSLGGGATMGGDTAAHSLGDQSTLGDAHEDDELFDDGMELVDLSTRYTEEGVLGKGGFGEVVLAADTRLERKVAIKRIQGKAARSKTAVQRFLTEAKSIAALSHNNIVQIYDYGRSTDGPFLIMECVQGGSLYDLSRKGPIDLDKAVDIFSQVCDGLAKAHAENIIHRDIKPANILMTEDGIPKLTDFGLAKDDTADTGMTMDGAVIGTLDFMPPEQRRGAEFTDHRSDLWSLAATFYQMLTGKSPKVINIASLPAKLQSVVAKALEESKDDRFQSAMEMREAILQAHSGKMDTSRSLGEGECPQCATGNPSNGKFCIECSAVLQVQCLKCEVEIQIWNKACGDCGAQQAAIVEKSLAELKKIHDQAETLLADLKFDEAANKAAIVGGKTDSRLQQFKTWHEDFSARLDVNRNEQHQRVANLLSESRAHEMAKDYTAAIRTLEQVPKALLNVEFSSHSAQLETSAKAMLDVLHNKFARSMELGDEIYRCVDEKQIEGLLPLVNEFLELRGSEPDVEALKVKLEQRHAKMEQNRGELLSRAKELMDEYDYDKCRQILRGISKEVTNAEVEDLQRLASDRFIKTSSLKQSIASSLQLNELNGLLPKVQQYLLLKPNDVEIIKLHESLISRKKESDGQIRNATAFRGKCEFGKAVAFIDALPADRSSAQLVALRTECATLYKNQSELVRHVNNYRNAEQFAPAIEMIDEYLKSLGAYGLNDNKVILLRKRLIDKEVDVQNANKRSRLVKTVASFLVCVLVSLIGVFVINPLANQATKRSLERHIANQTRGQSENREPVPEPQNAQVQTLLNAGEWQRVLEIDPSDAEALSLRRVAISTALAKGDWKSVLEIDPDNVDAVQLKWKSENLAPAANENGLPSLDSTVSVRLQQIIKEIRAGAITYSGHNGPVTSLAFSPDGNSIISGCKGGVFKVWDVDDERANVTLSGFGTSLLSMAINFDGTQFAVSSEDDVRVFVYDGENGNNIFTLNNGGTSAISCLAYSADGDRIISGDQDGTISLWNSQNGRGLGTMLGHSGTVTYLTFNSDGRLFASGDDSEKSIRICNAETAKLVAVLEGHGSYVTSARFSPDGSQIASASWDNTVKSWSVPDGKEIASFSGHLKIVTSVAYSMSGRHIASGGGDKTIIIWNSQSGEQVIALPNQPDYVSSVAFSPNGNLVASGNGNGTIRIHSVGDLFVELARTRRNSGN